MFSWCCFPQDRPFFAIGVVVPTFFSSFIVRRVISTCVVSRGGMYEHHIRSLASTWIIEFSNAPRLRTPTPNIFFQVGRILIKLNVPLNDSFRAAGVEHEHFIWSPYCVSLKDGINFTMWGAFEQACPHKGLGELFIAACIHTMPASLNERLLVCVCPWQVWQSVSGSFLAINIGL